MILPCSNVRKSAGGDAINCNKEEQLPQKYRGESQDIINQSLVKCLLNVGNWQSHFILPILNRYMLL